MNAPGGPGLSPVWSRGSKDAVGTALGNSRVWYTIGRGILTEIYWPSCSTPQVRDFGFIVAGEDFWDEVKCNGDYALHATAAGVPLITVKHHHKRYQLHLEILADPMRDVVLVRYRLHGDKLKLYALLAPHLDGSGHANTALVLPDGLAAVKASTALMLGANGGFSRSSAGFVGSSDGWQDFHRNGAMTWQYPRAANGNVALMGELNRNDGVLALGFAETIEGARTLALSSLAIDFDETAKAFTEGWQHWSRHLHQCSADEQIERAVRRAAMVIKCHGDRSFPGATVASLSTPWGFTRDDPGGYHLVWSRDAVQAGLAMIACGHIPEARNMLAYLIATQQDDGHWTQNFYADGRPYWHGIQLDEAAFPVLLAARLDALDALDGLRPQATEMARRALRFVAHNGPISQQDRWEESAGINPFTLGVCIAALVAAAAHGFLEDYEAAYALSLADNWNARIESWLYVRDTDLDREHGLQGHYVLLCPADGNAQRSDIELRNRGGETIAARDLVGLEYLYLVRLGLRAANDPRIVETTCLIDKLLRVDTPHGPFYHRYNEDGYGEHADGRAYDGTGIGRAWPLLSGERGHYAALAGDDARPYLDAMLASTSAGGMIPEQVWDSAAIDDCFLFPGRPTGSAMPLAWAHGELIKLVATMQCGTAVESLPAVQDRYRRIVTPDVAHWREHTPCRSVKRDQTLLVEADAPFTLHLGYDSWQTPCDLDSQPTAFGMHGVHVDITSLGARQTIEFTRRFHNTRDWEGRDWHLLLLPLVDKAAARAGHGDAVAPP
ncbi:MAG TPA: glycoside hydrolase family 15 protein [Rhodanobacteraceae bacterium]